MPNKTVEEGATNSAEKSWMISSCSNRLMIFCNCIFRNVNVIFNYELRIKNYGTCLLLKKVRVVSVCDAISMHNEKVDDSIK